MIQAEQRLLHIVTICSFCSIASFQILLSNSKEELIRLIGYQLPTQPNTLKIEGVVPFHPDAPGITTIVLCNNSRRRRSIPIYHLLFRPVLLLLSIYVESGSVALWREIVYPVFSHLCYLCSVSSSSSSGRLVFRQYMF